LPWVSKRWLLLLVVMMLVLLLLLVVMMLVLLLLLVLLVLVLVRVVVLVKQQLRSWVRWGAVMRTVVGRRRERTDARCVDVCVGMLVRR
jgi:hypothetical protein